uniref:subtilisin-like protease n=1 Tax=Fragaria vesca subsp. vesca TaxID=101020 RepID=UPI0005C84456|nr:PREDICTED: subtilisin-like protease [Fragaria vesca subsp. vesca]
MATLALLVLCSILFSITVSAISHTYIIHMDSSAMPKAFLDHQKWYLATLSSLSEGLLEADEATSSASITKLIYTYTNAIQGFSATLTLSELESLKSSPGFISYIRDRPLKLHTTRSSQFHGLTPLSGAWPASNYGENVTIGVIDTGVWPESESFNDEGMTPIPSKWKGKCESGTQSNSSLCNKKLIGARIYYKGFIAENPDLDISMKSARDTIGHGTHTSSIAAGNYVKGASYFGYATGKAVGMAPRARIAMYKVGWYNQASASDVLAAVDQSIQDGVDILSFSLGYSLDAYLYHDIIAIATFGAGHITPNKALDPGLVYDAAADDYIALLCAMNYTAKQIQIITGSIYICTNRFNIDLNYPSFIAYFNNNGSNSDAKVVQEFRRTLTNVGEKQSSYFVNLTPMVGLKLKVEPQKLVFTKKYEKLRYKLTIVGPKLLKEDVVQGSLIWIDDGGKYVVRCPIVATNIVPDSLIWD